MRDRYSAQAFTDSELGMINDQLNKWETRFACDT
jgi:hypothetical protein